METNPQPNMLLLSKKTFIIIFVLFIVGAGIGLWAYKNIKNNTVEQDIQIPVDTQVNENTSSNIFDSKKEEKKEVGSLFPFPSTKTISDLPINIIDSDGLIKMPPLDCPNHSDKTEEQFELSEELYKYINTLPVRVDENSYSYWPNGYRLDEKVKGPLVQKILTFWGFLPEEKIYYQLFDKEISVGEIKVDQIKELDLNFAYGIGYAYDSVVDPIGIPVFKELNPKVGGLAWNGESSPFVKNSFQPILLINDSIPLLSNEQLEAYLESYMNSKFGVPAYLKVPSLSSFSSVQWTEFESNYATLVNAKVNGGKFIDEAYFLKIGKAFYDLSWTSRIWLDEKNTETKVFNGKILNNSYDVFIVGSTVILITKDGKFSTIMPYWNYCTWD